MSVCEERKQLIAKLKAELGHEFCADDFVIDEALSTLLALTYMVKDGRTLCAMDEDGNVVEIQTMPFSIVRQKLRGI